VLEYILLLFSEKAATI